MFDLTEMAKSDVPVAVSAARERLFRRRHGQSILRVGTLLTRSPRHSDYIQLGLTGSKSLWHNYTQLRDG